MAKKDLQALMSGIMGTSSTDSSLSQSTAKTETAPDSSIQEQKSPSSDNPQPGEKNHNESTGDVLTRTSFQLPSEMLKKLKYISMMEECSQREIVMKALWAYIDRWEATNGKIKFRKT